MNLKAVFFDLDGTLLPMDQEIFVKAYFSLLAKKMAPHGFDPQLLVKGIWAGTEAMIRNDGSCTNEERFWQVFPTVCGERVREYEPVLDDFYRKEFQQVKDVCGFDADADRAVKAVREKGWMAVLATNPIFPSVATESRAKWAGLDLSDFAHYTVYENSSSSKPNLLYYQSLLDRFGLKGEEVLMVGNDVGEDMIAETLGMKTFLITRDLINKKNEDVSRWPNGTLTDLISYLERI
jgi:FMN phosphatase YigB (HAD superfamily)